VWRVWCHLVYLTIVTHSQTSPSERSHSSDIDSRKNDLKIRHNGPQNVKAKSSPKISWWYHGQHTSFVYKKIPIWPWEGWQQEFQSKPLPQHATYRLLNKNKNKKSDKQIDRFCALGRCTRFFDIDQTTF